MRIIRKMMLMTEYEFEQFVQENGKDILRFCIMETGSREAGDELYQDTMLMLLRKREKLDSAGNVKAYALSVSLHLLRNRRRKYAGRERIAGFQSLESLREEAGDVIADSRSLTPEEEFARTEDIALVRETVRALPEKLREPLLLFYSSDMKMAEIAAILHIPEGTVKSRIRKAKSVIRKELEEKGYER